MSGHSRDSIAASRHRRGSKPTLGQRQQRQHDAENAKLIRSLVAAPIVRQREVNQRDDAEAGWQASPLCHETGKSAASVTSQGFQPSSACPNAGPSDKLPLSRQQCKEDSQRLARCKANERCCPAIRSHHKEEV